MNKCAIFQQYFGAPSRIRTLLLIIFAATRSAQTISRSVSIIAPSFIKLENFSYNDGCRRKYSRYSFKTHSLFCEVSASTYYILVYLFMLLQLVLFPFFSTTAEQVRFLILNCSIDHIWNFIAQCLMDPLYLSVPSMNMMKQLEIEHCCHYYRRIKKISKIDLRAFTLYKEHHIGITWSCFKTIFQTLHFFRLLVAL